jgi:signal transduction histidine kinase
MDSEFLHAVIHDLRGPVSRVRMLGELVTARAPALDPDTETLLRHIGTAAASAEAVLEGLRRYAEALDRPFQPRSIDLADVLDSAMSRLGSEIQASGGTVTSGDLPKVYGDPVQLAALFRELIGNSLRFRSEAPPEIRVTASGDASGGWTISVADNGDGIEPAMTGRIFLPFGKASERAGAGMGLAICDRIAKTHGGWLRAAPSAAGAELQFRLPAPF